VHVQILLLHEITHYGVVCQPFSVAGYTAKFIYCLPMWELERFYDSSLIHR
jgi:hypothetical protein